MLIRSDAITRTRVAQDQNLSNGECADFFDTKASTLLPLVEQVDKSVTISGRKLAEFRRRRLALTQQELAVALGMSKGRISDLEAEEPGALYLRNFRKLAELAKVTIEELRREIGSDGTGMILSIAASATMDKESWQALKQAIRRLAEEEKITPDQVLDRAYDLFDDHEGRGFRKAGRPG
jgi:transcriptional regulator with XRE-family HTH domain